MRAIDLYLRAAEELDEIEGRMKALSSTSQEGWRKDYIALRRRLQEQIFALYPPKFDLNHLEAPQQKTLQSVYYDLRATATSHQANWPVIKIDAQDPTYLESAVALRKASDVLINFVRELARSQSKGA